MHLNTIHTWIHGHNQSIILATDSEGEAIGACVFSVDRQPFAKLESLYVEDDHQGQGVGSALLAEVERLTWDDDCEHITLTLHADSKLADWYASRGYLPCYMHPDAKPGTLELHKSLS
jgi:GNAT superfamily N-acetyltransferase